MSVADLKAARVLSASGTTKLSTLDDRVAPRLF
jgi:hypothetical protein